MKKAFVLVDFQNDFIDGSLGFQKAKDLKEGILQKLSSLDFKTTNLLITFDTHGEGYLQSKEGKILPIFHCQKNTKGWEMPSEFKPFLHKATKIFYKNAFASLELIDFIHKSKYEELHFCGLVSHICVFCNIILALAAKPNAKFILHQDLTASFDANLEKCAFDLLKAYGVEII